MEIIAIMGSPRRGGNCEVLLDEFLRERGKIQEVKTLIPAQMDIGFCRGCRSCESTGHCVLSDDMQGAADLLMGCKGVILSAPVFFYGFPASMKAFIDRMQFLWSRKYFLKKQFEEKKGFLLSVGATRGKRLFEGVKLTTRYFFDSFGCEYSGDAFFRGFDRKGEIAQCGECLQEVRIKATDFFTSIIKLRGAAGERSENT